LLGHALVEAVLQDEQQVHPMQTELAGMEATG